MSGDAMSGAYRAVWRWHFYAGLIVLPVLCLMAITGALYLFNDEIEGTLHHGAIQVRPAPIARSADAWIAAATAAVPGRAVSLRVPARPDEAVRVVVEAGDHRVTVFVDPYTARITGRVKGGGLMETVKRLHSLEIVGKVANVAVEVVAGWAIVLVATGLFLWWPRGRGGGVATVRGRPGQRLFWRDLHAVTGAFAGAGILFLAVSGMPWSAVWGANLRTVITAAGIGRPPGPGVSSEHHHDPGTGVPWTLRETAVSAMGHGPTVMPPASVAALMAQAEGMGLPRPFTLTLPADGKAASMAYMPDKVEDTRTLYLDPADTRVLADIGYARFGWGAQLVEWGISVHQGQQFGRLNQILMLGFCVSILLLATSAVVMWWKRRPPGGGLGAPSVPPGPRVRVAVWGIVLPLCLIYPLTGLSLVAALLLDRLVTVLSLRFQRSAT